MPMTASNNNPKEQLEPALPVFPLSGALLLPNSQLPLNIFEPRYLAMIDAAMSKNGMIGMIQPRDPGPKPVCYDIGCAGKIVEYAELDDGRYLVALGGLCRFRVIEELPVTTAFRQMMVSYDGFEQTDLAAQSERFLADRDALIASIDAFLKKRDLACDWDAVDAADDESLVNGICMVAPFQPPEKQALLEAQDLAKRAVLLQSLLDFDVAGADDLGQQKPH